MQSSWRERHGGVAVSIEKALITSGKLGRTDVRVVVSESGADDPIPFEAVIELKDRDFDRLAPRTVRRLIARDRRQLLRYVAALVDLNSALPASPAESHVMGSMSYAHSPSDSALKHAIEAFFDQELLAVIWEDETIAAAKARLG